LEDFVMRTPTNRQAAARTLIARAPWCMVGIAALGLMLAACSGLGAGSANTRQFIGERPALDGEYYLGADPNFQGGSNDGGG
jgi:hypothetical protein